MYSINNVVESALRKPSDRLSILVLNEMQDAYIERLDSIGHDFYIANDMYNVRQWNKGRGYKNIHIVNRLNDACLTHIDAILVFNRAGLWERAKALSDMWHVPYIVIDMASSMNRVPCPFFADVNISNPQELFIRNGMASVGITENICNSWQSHYQTFSMPIGIPARPFETKPEADKVLIDNTLPQEYIDSLPVDINEERFTTNPEYAKLYLHLWQTVTPLMIDCMASNVPVVTFQSNDFVEVIQKQACVLIQDIRIIDQPTFMQEMLEFPMLETIKKNQQEYAAQTSQEEFNKLWDSVLQYATSNRYLRGIA